MGNYKRNVNNTNTDSGIYCITNKINNKKYVGQTYSIKNRWSRHKRELNNNRHHNSHLQSAWNKYGENNFDFSILELCEIIELNDKEKYWIEKLNTFNEGYNLTSGDIGCRGYVHTEEELQKMRNAHNPKPIYQLDEELKIIKEWESCSQASKVLGLYNQAIENCCKKINHVKSVGGFIWIYKEDYNNIDKDYYLIKNISMSKRIGQFDSNLKLIKAWESIYELDKTSDSGPMVSSVCNHKRNSYKGFIWAFIDEDGCFIDDYNYSAIKIRTVKQVVQCDMDGNYIEKYSSLREASNITGFDKHYISDACNSIRDSYKNYIWKFA